MKLPVKFTATAISALALASSLAACDGKNNDTPSQAAATASPSAPAATENTSNADGAIDANRQHDDNMTDEMTERHRQKMDHDDMRRGGPMGPGAAPVPTSTPAAPPMKDM